MHKLYKQKYTCWKELEKEIELVGSNKERGDAFEEFAYFYYQYHSVLYQITDLYCPVATGKLFPKAILDKLQLERKDVGVDGVYLTVDKRWIAFQCKFRSGRTTLVLDELATFWTEAENADGRVIFSNTRAVTSIAKKKAGHSVVLCDILDALDERFFSALQAYAVDAAKTITRRLKQPRPYQKLILDSLVSGLEKNPKGKLIAACGIGKTLIALWLIERRKDNLILFLAPSLQLIRQTLGEWSKEAKSPFQYLCVCSDKSVDLEDEQHIALSDLDISVTTDTSLIRDFLSSTGTIRRIVFSTYQSVPMIRDALVGQTFSGFDLIIFDEAHRTAGVSASNLFSLAVDEKTIPGGNRLFMTATERLVGARIKKAAKQADQVVFSMDNKKLYGETLYHLSFGQAIKDKIISDYRIVFAGLTISRLNKILQQNRYVSSKNNQNGESEITAAQDIFRLSLLYQCFIELNISKVITFHSKVSEAKLLATCLVKSEAFPRLSNKSSFSHLNGTMTSAERSEYISLFEEAELGVLTNVRCLTEGVDIPLIDGIFFANPRGSQIDILQAVGRALRQPYGQDGKIAYIIIPILLDEQSGKDLTGDSFDTLFNVIQALRDQDETLAEWIDQINLGAVSGKSQRGQSLGKIKIIVPPDFDLSALESSLLLKIAEVNRDPSEHVAIGSKLGKRERKSTYTRVFKTLCDYRPDVVFKKLVMPTLKRFRSPSIAATSTQLKFSNNNISHCCRLGVISETKSNSYSLTNIGLSLYTHKIDYIELFKNQMLLFSYGEGKARFFPYRYAFELMARVESIGFIEFVYGLYSLNVDEEKKVLLDQAIKRTIYVKNKYPNAEITSEANKAIVLDDLNSKHPVGFAYTDVWTDRTTTGNQFRYTIRHLELYDDIFEFRNKRLALKPKGNSLIEKYLKLTEPMITSAEYGKYWWLDEA